MPVPRIETHPKTGTHPKIETVYKNIADWAKENFVKVELLYHIKKDEFEFGRVTNISRVWKENNYWIVDAVVEYQLGQLEMRTLTFQIDQLGRILGYDFHEPLMKP